MSGSGVALQTRGGEAFDGYLSVPGGDGKVPGLLIVTSIFGVDEEMRRLADQWADDGFLVCVPDIFWRRDPGPTADLQFGLERMARFDCEQGLMDIEDVLAQLRAHPRCNGRIAVLGFCFGGQFAHLAATRLGADAAGAFHGTGMAQHLDEAAALRVPVSYHFGEADPVVPLEEVAAIRQAFADNPLVEIAVHDGAPHSFSMPEKPGYDPRAAAASREAVLLCFRTLSTER